jgi:hypothetical protein
LLSPPPPRQPMSPRGFPIYTTTKLPTLAGSFRLGPRGIFGEGPPLINLIYTLYLTMKNVQEYENCFISCCIGKKSRKFLSQTIIDAQICPIILVVRPKFRPLGNAAERYIEPGEL